MREPDNRLRITNKRVSHEKADIVRDDFAPRFNPAAEHLGDPQDVWPSLTIPSQEVHEIDIRHLIVPARSVLERSEHMRAPGSPRTPNLPTWETQANVIWTDDFIRPQISERAPTPLRRHLIEHVGQHFLLFRLRQRSHDLRFDRNLKHLPSRPLAHLAGQLLLFRQLSEVIARGELESCAASAAKGEKSIAIFVRTSIASSRLMKGRCEPNAALMPKVGAWPAPEPRGGRSSIRLGKGQ